MPTSDQNTNCAHTCVNCSQVLCFPSVDEPIVRGEAQKAGLKLRPLWLLKGLRLNPWPWSPRKRVILLPPFPGFSLPGPRQPTHMQYEFGSFADSVPQHPIKRSIHMYLVSNSIMTLCQKAQNMRERERVMRMRNCLISRLRE